MSNKSAREILLESLEGVEEARKRTEESSAERNRREQERYDRELRELHSELGVARIHDHARKSGLSFGDAVREFYPKPPELVETGYPLSDSHIQLHASVHGLEYREAAEELSGRGFVRGGVPRPPTQSELDRADRERWGFTSGEAHDRARGKNITLSEAGHELAAERNPVVREPEEQTRVPEAESRGFSRAEAETRAVLSGITLDEAARQLSIELNREGS
jgi:hypothetical protein